MLTGHRMVRTFYVEFDRLLNTSDPYDYVIDLNGTMPVIWAGNKNQSIRMFYQKSI